MGFKYWEDKTFLERAEQIAECFPTLTDEEIIDEYDKLQQNDYENNMAGEDRAIADFFTALNQRSLNDEQREAQKRRIADELKRIKDAYSSCNPIGNVTGTIKLS